MIRNIQALGIFFLMSFTQRHIFKVKLNATQKGKYYNVKKRATNHFNHIVYKQKLYAKLIINRYDG